MIRDSNGNRTTPRRYAQDVIMDALSTAAMRVYDERYSNGTQGAMTEREREEVLRFIRQEADRCARLLGYTECVQQ